MRADVDGMKPRTDVRTSVRVGKEPRCEHVFRAHS
jgi:hypothetical protein